MKKHLLILCMLCAIATAFAQNREQQNGIAIFVGDSAWNMTSVSTVSEVTNGWSVQGIEVKKAKISRYLNNTQALQKASDRRPRFRFRILSGALNDYALIELSVKKNYRKFSSSELPRCSYKRIEPEYFNITPVGTTDFIVQPAIPLSAGEYVWVNLKQSPINTYGDVVVYDFSVK